MSYFCSIDTNNQQKNIHMTITFSLSDWACFPSGLNQHSIKDNITKFRSFEFSVKRNTIRYSSCNQVNISQRSETTVKLFSQNKGEPPDTFIPPFGNKNQNVPPYFPILSKCVFRRQVPEYQNHMLWIVCTIGEDSVFRFPVCSYVEPLCLPPLCILMQQEEVYQQLN